jgi:hypothetical protein
VTRDPATIFAVVMLFGLGIALWVWGGRRP